MMLRKLTGILPVGLACLVSYPIVLVAFASLKSSVELAWGLAPVLTDAGGMVDWHLLPFYPTLSHYIKILFQTPEFFTVFWNSVKITLLILAGQMLLAVPAAWAFARYSFPGRRVLFSLYLILMLMPFQVMMLPNYLVLDHMHLINTQAAVIFPAVFSAFPVFLVYRGFVRIPREALEAARMDGAGEGMVFFRIGIPLAWGSILSMLVLGYLECWSLLEQPLAFLQDKKLWPLSLYLPVTGSQQAGEALAASVITLIPAALVFMLGQDYLEQGIASSALKE